MEESKVYTLKAMKEALESCFSQIPVAKINLHTKKSHHSDTIFSTIILPVNKAFKIFGDCEILYPQLSNYGDDNDIPCVKFGIVVED